MSSIPQFDGINRMESIEMEKGADLLSKSPKLVSTIVTQLVVVSSVGINDFATRAVRGPGPSGGD
jgi:hypothetical protein